MASRSLLSNVFRIVLHSKEHNHLQICSTFFLYNNNLSHVNSYHSLQYDVLHRAATLIQSNPVAGHLLPCQQCGIASTVALRVIQDSSTVSGGSTEENAPQEGFLKRIINNTSIAQSFHRRLKMRRAGMRLYLCAAEIVDRDVFFKEFELDDTFYSLFNITALHVWFLLSRLGDGKHEKRAAHRIIAIMWRDLEQRMKKMGPKVSVKHRKDGLKYMNSRFREAVHDYNVGLAGDDVELGAALHKHFFGDKSDDEKIKKMAKYVHKQINHMHTFDKETLLTTGLVSFLQLNSFTVDVERTKFITREIVRRCQAT